MTNGNKKLEILTFCTLIEPIYCTSITRYTVLYAVYVDNIKKDIWRLFDAFAVFSTPPPTPLCKKAIPIQSLVYREGVCMYAYVRVDIPFIFIELSTRSWKGRRSTTVAGYDGHSNSSSC